MLEVEVLGAGLAGALSQGEIERLCALAAASAGIESGHLAVEFVGAGRIAELNALHRGKREPTDVLSFPIDGAEPIGVPAPAAPASPSAVVDADTEASAGPPRELGDIVVCPEHTLDLREAIVHGALHLLGMDHENDDGEMLALQAKLLQGV